MTKHQPTVAVVYRGPLARPQAIPSAGVIAKRGEPVEVPAELAAELVTRDGWALAELEAEPAGDDPEPNPTKPRTRKAR